MKRFLVAFILVFQVLTAPCQPKPDTVTLDPQGKILDLFVILQRTGHCNFTYDDDDIPPLEIAVRLEKVPVLKAIDSIFRNLPVKVVFDTLVDGVYWFSVSA